MNAAAFAALRKQHVVHYAGPINPPAFLTQRMLSKLLRVAGSRGDFFFFSQRRLEAIAREVHAKCLAEARLDFFHGFTPWILTRPRRPYVAWSDCTFLDYIDIFHNRDQFRHEDLERIEEAEAAWLRNARSVLFTSDWAAGRAVSCYGLDADRVASVGIFGEVEMPDRDAYAGGKEFAFISTNFEAKGGRIVLAAFRELKTRHPDASLIVVGDKPPNAATEPGVKFVGFLRKELPDECARFQQILSRARALVNATRSDTASVMLIEAGYHGCPVISSRMFATPELVDNSRTGLLLDAPSQVTAVAAAMNWMLEHEDEYLRMRAAAWAKTREQHSKPRFEKQLLSFVCDAATDKELSAR